MLLFPFLCCVPFALQLFMSPAFLNFPIWSISYIIFTGFVISLHPLPFTLHSSYSLQCVMSWYSHIQIRPQSFLCFPWIDDDSISDPKQLWVDFNFFSQLLDASFFGVSFASSQLSLIMLHFLFKKLCPLPMMFPSFSFLFFNSSGIQMSVGFPKSKNMASKMLLNTD